MKFKVDEDLPIEVAELLRDGGHDALTVNDQQLSGVSDPSLMTVCSGEERAILTLDLDFADIRAIRREIIGGL